MAEKKTDYGSGFMYAEDLLVGGKFHTVQVEIAEVHAPNTVKRADGQLIDKIVVGFKGKNKKLCLCKTNVRVIHMVTGEQPGPEWVGKRITLQAREIKAFGELTLALRAIPPTGMLISKAVRDRLGKPAEYRGEQQPAPAAPPPPADEPPQSAEITDEEAEEIRRQEIAEAEAERQRQ